MALEKLYKGAAKEITIAVLNDDDTPIAHDDITAVRALLVMGADTMAEWHTSPIGTQIEATPTLTEGEYSLKLLGSETAAFDGQGRAALHVWVQLADADFDVDEGWIEVLREDVYQIVESPFAT